MVLVTVFARFTAQICTNLFLGRCFTAYNSKVRELYDFRTGVLSTVLFSPEDIAACC